MRVCAISFKECWRSPEGLWVSDGGFPKQMAGIASLFDEMELLVVSVPPRAGGYPLPPKANVVPLRQPCGQNGRRKLSLALNLHYYAPILARHILNADVVHVPLPGDIPLLGMLLAVACRRKLLARYGGSWQSTSQTTLMNRVTRTFMKRFARGPNVMLATGCGEDKPAPGIEWIFSTALTAKDVQDINPRLARGLASPPQLVYAGRLSPEKGLSVLLSALTQLRDGDFHPLPRLTLIGDGPERTSLEHQIAELNLQNLVRLTGQLDRRRLSEEIIGADLCVQPSLTEGFSKAWLDAMAHGLPVLASDVGAARSVVGSPGQRGWSIPPGNPGVLAEALRSALTSEIDWPALRRRCREYAESLTVENWQTEIGRICCQRWNLRLQEGRLIAPEMVR